MFLYEVLPLFTCIMVVLILLSALFPMVAMNSQMVKSADGSGPLLSMMLTASCLLAAFSGIHTYYAYVQPLNALSYMASYKNVDSGLPAVSLNDASYVEFTSDTKVDTSKSVSFKSLETGHYTFCVAPIVASKSAGRVQFWAVGVDCCGAAGDFECGSAGDANAHAGLVMRDPPEEDVIYSWLGKYLAPPEVRKDIFEKAVHKAEGEHAITTPESFMMVKWTNKSKDDIISDELWAICRSMVLAILAAFMASIILTIIYNRFTSFHAAHDRLAQAGVEKHHTTRILDFFHHISATNKEPDEPSLKDVALVHVLIPYLVLISCLFLWSFAYCSRFGNLILAPFFILLLFKIVALLMTPNRFVSGLLILLVAVTGTYLGFYNFDNNLSHYCAVEGHRSYSNVFADADVSEYSDAGKLKFEKSAKIVEEWSVGFKYDNVMYCAAPVVSCSGQEKSGQEKSTTSNGQANATQSANSSSSTQSNSSSSDTQSSSSSSSEFLQETQDADSASDTSDTQAAGDAGSNEGGEQGEQQFLQLGTKRSQKRLGMRRSQKRFKFLATGVESSALALLGDSSELGRNTSEPSNSTGNTSAPSNSTGNTSADESQEPASASSCKVPSRIDFWAVGRDCCKGSGEFWCGDAEDDDAKSAVMFYNFEGSNSDDGNPWKQYHRAVHKSADSFGLPFPEKPMLVKWGHDADKLHSEWMSKAIGILVLTSVVGLFAIVAFACTGYYFAKQSYQRSQPRELEPDRGIHKRFQGNRGVRSRRFDDEIQKDGEAKTSARVTESCPG